MASFSYNLITINGKFHSVKPLVRSYLWSVSKEELQKIFPGGEMKNNFIKLKFECGIVCLVFKLGSFKVVFNEKNSIHLITKMKQIIMYIRCKHANLLFQNKLLSSTYRVTQIQMSIRCIEEKTIKLSFEKVVAHFPPVYIKDMIKIPFQNSIFFLLVDHTQHETGSSHLNFRIEINEKNVALCKIFCNFKNVVFLKYTTYLNEIFHLVSEFCHHLHRICSAT